MTLFCVLGVVLQTILDVYDLFYLYRNDPTPCNIDRWLVFQTLYIYIYITPAEPVTKVKVGRLLDQLIDVAMSSKIKYCL
jgi:hypothetical protein